MNTQILEEIGLTKTEIKIYLALLKLGQSTTTNIIREAEINASKVYEFLDKLIQKGLVSYVIKANKKYFTTTNPKALREFLYEKQKKIQKQRQEIDKIIPKLNIIKSEKKDIIKSEIYEGLKGLKSIYEKILTNLDKGETQYIIGAPKIGNELLGAGHFQVVAGPCAVESYEQIKAVTKDVVDAGSKIIRGGNKSWE